MNPVKYDTFEVLHGQDTFNSLEVFRDWCSGSNVVQLLVVGRTDRTLDYLQECTCLFSLQRSLLQYQQVHQTALQYLTGRSKKKKTNTTHRYVIKKRSPTWPKKQQLKPSGLTCIARGNGFRDVWAEDGKVEMARLQRSTSRKGLVRLSSGGGREDGCRFTHHQQFQHGCRVSLSGGVEQQHSGHWSTAVKTFRGSENCGSVNFTHTL